MNKVKDINSHIYYADTDSIIINESAQEEMMRFMKKKIHKSELGCMKNEYPKDSD